MSELLYEYKQVDPTTWAYLSSLLMIGLFFKFNRFWSVRNLDIVLLILLAPGLLLVHLGQEMRQRAAELSKTEVAAAPAKPAETPPPTAESEKSTQDGDRDPMQKLLKAISAPEEATQPTQTPSQQIAERGIRNERWGYLALFAAGGVLLVRLLADPTMVRRPLLEPNLSPGGLSFLACSLFIFLVANVITSTPTPSTQWPKGAPGWTFIEDLPSFVSGHVSDPEDFPDGTPPAEPQAAQAGTALAKTIVILAHLGVVMAMIGIGWRHFDNMKMGVGAATLYLMLPYTSQMTGSAYHVVPAAFLSFAVLFYRRPLTAGLFIGLAIRSYYPLFLLPLWLSFYWQRGLMRFISGVLTTVALMATMSLVRTGGDLLELQRMFGALPFRMTDLSGIWGLGGFGWAPWYRVPMLAAFLVLACSFALWPAQKNFGTLLSCSAAVMLGVQFWHGDGGGLFMAWYLPLLLLTIFRPNLEDRVALSVLGEGWFPRRRYAATAARDLDRAA